MEENKVVMEVLYVWINKYKRISKSGFNFSSEYKFELVEAAEDDNPEKKYVLKILRLANNVQAIKDLYNYGLTNKNIQNISAVVGKNGSGKTSLLYNLISLGFLQPKQEETRDAYKEYNEEDYESNKRLFICKKNGQIVIYHNLENLRKESGEEVDITENPLVNSKGKDVLEKQIDEITSVYITNSTYTPRDEWNRSNDERGSVSSDGKVSQCVLTLGNVAKLGKQFFDELINVEISLPGYKNRFFVFNKAIIQRKQYEDFQEICDLLFYLNAWDEEHGSNLEFLDGVDTTVGINAGNIIKIFRKLAGDEQTKENDFIGKDFKNRYDSYSNWIKVQQWIDIDDQFVTNILYVNLFFELQVVCNSKYTRESHFWKETQKDKDGLRIIKGLVDELIEELDKKESVLASYYNNAKLEIEKLSVILGESEPAKNIFPKSDMAYDRNRYIRSKNKKVYKQLLDFVRECFDKNEARGNSAVRSFILKYLYINKPNISSGERARQNFFSWLQLVPEFYKINCMLPRDLKDNLLLLVDEADLYLHPEWQRTFLDKLIRGLSLQFKEKNIQIILATHSPLMLSDIPKENIIYLDECREQDKTYKKQTLGANIHMILKEPFFMEGSTLGEIIRKNINENVINKLKSNEWEADKKKIKGIIDLVGEPIIRHKLEHMYYEHFPEEKMMDIGTYQEQILRLQTQLASNNKNGIRMDELQNSLEIVLDQIKKINSRGTEKEK